MLAAFEEMTGTVTMNEDVLCRVPIRELTIPPDGTHIIVAAFVNGQLANVLIDTGASQTVMDRNRIGLFSTETEFEPTGQVSKGLGTDAMESHRFSLTQFILGDLVLEDMPVTLLDLSHVNSSYRELDLCEVDMVLGGDILRTYGAMIDYGSWELVLRVG
jgi:hypothetical protein